jgi:hypothetical protein
VGRQPNSRSTARCGSPEVTAICEDYSLAKNIREPKQFGLREDSSSEAQGKNNREQRSKRHLSLSSEKQLERTYVNFN